MNCLTNPVVWVLKGLIRGYQYGISPLLGPVCRYTPSCSAYMLESITHFGLFKGVWHGCKRILRCHPWGGQGEDPVVK